MDIMLTNKHRIDGGQKTDGDIKGTNNAANYQVIGIVDIKLYV